MIEIVDTPFGPMRVIVDEDMPRNTFVLTTLDSAVAAVEGDDGWQVVELLRPAADPRTVTVTYEVAE